MEHVFLKVAPCKENQGSSRVIAVEIMQFKAQTALFKDPVRTAL
jgi:hypothetical protein